MSDYAKNRANEQHFAHLMSVPVVREGRIKLRDAVPFSDKTLARLCKPLTTETTVFRAKPLKGDRLGPVPTYADWLRSIGITPVKRKRAKVQMFTDSPSEAWRDLPCSTPL